MAKDKVFIKCKRFVEGDVCPVCKSNKFSDVHKGQLNILDANKSSIAQKMEIKEKGRYAIKVR